MMVYKEWCEKCRNESLHEEKYGYLICLECENYGL